MDSFVLYVRNENDATWLEGVKDSLRPNQTIQYSTQPEALEKAKGEECAVVLVDADSVTNAPELVRGIRGLNPAAKIIVLSSSPTWKRAQTAFLAGADDYLSKVLNRDDLFKLIDQCMGLKV